MLLFVYSHNCCRETRLLTFPEDFTALMSLELQVLRSNKVSE